MKKTYGLLVRFLVTQYNQTVNDHWTELIQRKSIVIMSLQRHYRPFFVLVIVHGSELFVERNTKMCG